MDCRVGCEVSLTWETCVLRIFDAQSLSWEELSAAVQSIKSRNRQGIDIKGLLFSYENGLSVPLIGCTC